MKGFTKIISQDCIFYLNEDSPHGKILYPIFNHKGVERRERFC